MPMKYAIFFDTVNKEKTTNKHPYLASAAALLYHMEMVHF